ncbi:MAG: hypothetical protein ACE5HB_07955 [Terriglobia bacterium]
MSAFVLLRCSKCGVTYSFESEAAAALREGDKCKLCETKWPATSTPPGFLERLPGKLVTLH